MALVACAPGLLAPFPITWGISFLICLIKAGIEKNC